MVGGCAVTNSSHSCSVPSAHPGAADLPPILLRVPRSVAGPVALAMVSARAQ